MRVLIIGDIYNIHVCNFVRYTLSEMDIDEIIAFHILGNKGNGKEYIDQYYREHNIKVIPQEGFSQSFENIIYHFFELKKMGRFDVCHLFGLSYINTSMGILMRPYCNTLIANYWGSDWLRSLATEKEQQKKLLKISDHIVSDSLQICEEITEYFDGEFKDKIKYIRYQLPVIEELKNYENVENKRRELVERFGVLPGQIVVTCGYSGVKVHKQPIIIAMIKELPVELQKKIFILIPVGYGRDEQHIIDIKKALADIATGYYVAEEFLDFNGVAALRSLTDIFINMQPTDAYSSTMIEYCYCKKAIFCNESLDYSRLEEEGVFYEKIDNFEQLKEILERYIENYDSEIVKYENNRVAAERFQGDSANNVMWEKIYTITDQNTDDHTENEADILQMLAVHYSRIEQTVKKTSVLLKRIVMIENIDIKIGEWLQRNKYGSIGIYGMGHLGRVLFRKLNGYGELLLSIYDKNVRNLDMFEIPVLEPRVMGDQKEDVIIITPAFYMDSIKKQYQNKINARLLTIVEWLDEIEQI